MANFAAELARLYYPLVLKSTLMQIEPIQWKGGFYRDLLKKGTLDPAIRDNSRSILVSSHVGKAARRCVRHKLVPAVAEFVGPFQFAGLAGRGTEPASLIVRQMQDLAAASKLTFGALFVDAISAYYRALRELIMKSDLCDENVAHIVQAAGLPPEAMHQLAQQLSQHPALMDQAGVSPAVQAQVVEHYRAPWFTCAAASTLALPQRSLFPGQPLADLLYALIFADVLKDVDAEMHELGITVAIPTDMSRSLAAHLVDPSQLGSTTTLSNVAYADDGTLLILGSATTVVHTLEKLLVIVADCMARRGQLLNYKPGKTAALVAFHGPGTKQARHDLWVTSQGIRHVSSPILGPLTLTFVHAYQHLGGWCDDKDSMWPEVLYRRAAPASSAKALQRKVHGNSHIHLHAKVHFADSLVLSGRLYNSGAWPSLPAAVADYVHAGVMQPYRAAARGCLPGHPERHIKDDYVLARVHRVQPATMIKAHRLRLFAVLLRGAPPAVFAVLGRAFVLKDARRLALQISQPTAWVHLLLDDLRWLQRYTTDLADLPELPAGLASWEQYIVQSPVRWKRLIRSALGADAAYHARIQKAAAAQDAIFAGLYSAGVPPPRYPLSVINAPVVRAEAPAQLLTGPPECPWCQRRFDKVHGLRTHIAREHRQHSRFARRWAQELPQCQACFRVFHNRDLLVDHLSIESPVCLVIGIHLASGPALDANLQLVRHCDPAAPAVLQRDACPGTLPSHARLRRRAAVPTYRAAGVLSELAYDMFAQLTPDVAKAILLDSDPVLSDAAREVLHGLSTVTPPEPPQLAAPVAAAQPVRYPSDLFSTADYVGEMAIMFPAKIKRVEFFIAHLFCGRRRDGDYQAQLEWAHDSPDFSIMILSVDIALDADKCDLSRSDSLAIWSGHVLAKRIILTGGGPPSETWSPARWTDSPGPPPIRTHEAFWGICAATARQARQLHIGNTLLIALATLLGLHAQVGTSGWMEHPLPCEWEARAPSSFSWAPLQALLLAPIASTADIDQCEFGLAAKAPARFLGLRMEQFFACLTDTPGHGHCSHGPNAHPALRGWDADKQEWRTAKRKTYPPRLCAALARSTWLTVQALWDPDESRYPDDLLDPDGARDELMAFYVGWDPYGSHDAGGSPDFAGAGGRARCRRCNPEKHRFQPPGHDVLPGSANTSVLDAPPDAVTEQSFADDLASAGVLPEEPPPPGPPPPELTEAQQARIRENRAAAQVRKAAKLQAARAARHLAVAPWIAQDLRFNF